MHVFVQKFFLFENSIPTGLCATPIFRYKKIWTSIASKDFWFVLREFDIYHIPFTIQWFPVSLNSFKEKFCSFRSIPSRQSSIKFMFYFDENIRPHPSLQHLPLFWNYSFACIAKTDSAMYTVLNTEKPSLQLNNINSNSIWT